jgi:hypothetical protein
VHIITSFVNDPRSTINNQHSTTNASTTPEHNAHNMFIKTTLLASALALCAFSAPLPGSGADPEPVGLTAQELVTIAEATQSCTGAEYPEECADATRAATAINASFKTYQITSTGEQAALVAYMLFESGNFKYSKNKSPGRPGQGTRMMAMPPFIEKYALAKTNATAVEQAKATGPDAVLALVNSNDEDSFGSAAWFMTSTCSPEVRKGLDEQTVGGWHEFLTQCVETTLDPLRDEPWVKAKQVMLG